MDPKHVGTLRRFIKRGRNSRKWNLIFMFLVLGCLLLSVAWKEEPQAEAFNGWIAYQDGQVIKYGRKEWKAEPDQASFTFRRLKNQDYVTYSGTFRVVELRKIRPPAPGGEPTRLSWSVTQGGFTHLYKRDDGWEIELNPNGIQFDKSRMRVWYYGTFLLDARDR